MKQRLIPGFALIVTLAAGAIAHDLFLKFDSCFLKPFSSAKVRLLNGEFNRSKNTVDRERMRDVSVLSPSGLINPPQKEWRDAGPTSLLSFQTGVEGTYVVALSTKAREIDLQAAEFNHYLAHDGLPDILAARIKNGELNNNVRERYSKHVKAIFQVGDKRTEDYKTSLDYPVEIILQQNPYDLRAGQTIAVKCLTEGKPITNQFVLAGWQAGSRLSPQIGVRTDPGGIARFPLRAAGQWYIKFIYMEAAREPRLDYESKWASVTFEVKK